MKIKEYVSLAKLDIIAITNHNHFDKEQFENIFANLNCKVLPGIEVDIESSHLLVIVPCDQVEYLVRASEMLSDKIKSEKDSIDYCEFVEIFPDYKKHILIPHYVKKPNMKNSTLLKFRDTISAGEVRSAKKFEVIKKEANSLAPVLFSDVRMDENLSDFPTRNTYIDVNSCEFNVIKNALSDKTKIFLSHSKTNKEFSILKDGTPASTGLNIILGKRSSGKTSILNAIFRSLDDNNIKYIEQFSLTGKSEENAFDQLVLKQKENEIFDYLKPLEDLTSKMLKIDDSCDSKVVEYLSSLKEYALNTHLKDEYSKSRLYEEVPFSYKKDTSFKKLCAAVDTLLADGFVKNLLDEDGVTNSLLLIQKTILAKWREHVINFKLMEKSDFIVKLIKEILVQKSSMKSIKEINLCDIYKNFKMIANFNDLCNSLKNEKVVSESDDNKFTLKITRKRFKSVKEVKSALKTKNSVKDSFNFYDNPFKYILSLHNEDITDTDIYKSIILFDVKVFNKQGNILSGGERAEYNLIREITDAKNYDILLLDEPEASFDNMFISEFIVDLLKDISQNTTVFITTHNNSLGMLINPDKIIFAVNSNNDFCVYTGAQGSKEFISADGKKIISYDNIMEVMEAGCDAYNARNRNYENFKN